MQSEAFHKLNECEKESRDMQLAILQAASLKLGFGFGILGLQESNQTQLAHQMSTHIRCTQSTYAWEKNYKCKI